MDGLRTDNYPDGWSEAAFCDYWDYEDGWCSANGMPIDRYDSPYNTCSKARRCWSYREVDA